MNTNIDKNENKVYDLIIIGGGPAGLTAGIYAGRAKMKTAIIEKGALGGQAFTTRELVNYPGFYSKDNATGPNIIKSMTEHAKRFEVEFIKKQITEVDLDGVIKVIKAKRGEEYKAKAVILSVGSQPRMLNIPGERTFRGNGVSYCATCDAEFYENMHVIVVGNGDAAIEEAMYIAKFAKKVTIIVIHEEGIVDCNKISAEKAFKHEKIEFVWKSVLTEIKGKDEVESVVIKNLGTGELTEMKAEGVFFYVGTVPGTDFVKGKLALDSQGYIFTSDDMSTSKPGVYAIGDCRLKYLRQVVTSASDGAVAAVAIERYLTEKEDFREYVLKSIKPTLLAFWSPFKEESIAIIEKIEKIIKETGQGINIFKIDLSRKKTIAQEYEVKEVPALFLLEKGKMVKNLCGKEELEIKQVLTSYTKSILKI